MNKEETSSDESDIIDMNISDIAEKILAVSISKKKDYKVVGVVKKLHPTEGVRYLVADHDGNKEEYNRAYMLEKHPQELLDFYEERIHEKYSLPK